MMSIIILLSAAPFQSTVAVGGGDYTGNVLNRLAPFTAAVSALLFDIEACGSVVCFTRRRIVVVNIAVY